MKKIFTRAEPHRANLPGMPPTKHGDRFGMFIIKQPKFQINIIADDGSETGWEHVSVSCKTKSDDGKIRDVTPPWDCMRMIKLMFWDDEECVLQFFPPESVYKNDKDNVLHLWRQVGVNHTTPPLILV